MIDSKKKLKVILSNKILPLVVSPPVFPHIIDIIKIGAAGDSMLPNKKTTRNIESLIDECLLAFTESGWINKDAFVLYSILFFIQIPHYRLNLPLPIRKEPILLIIDGHPSRRNNLANYIFSCFNVDLLILPCHTSHVLNWGKI